MARYGAVSEDSVLTRTPGMIAVAGSVVGTLLGVVTLFVVLYTDVPWWVPAWTAACGAVLLATGLWAWQRPRAMSMALHIGAVMATAGVGSSAPAIRMWAQLGLADPDTYRIEIAAVGVALGLLCACYLAFAATDLIRGARLETLARRAVPTPAQ
jgi:uncharacterized membrane protein YccC